LGVGGPAAAGPGALIEVKCYLHSITPLPHSTSVSGCCCADVSMAVEVSFSHEWGYKDPTHSASEADRTECVCDPSKPRLEKGEETLRVLWRCLRGRWWWIW